MFATKTYVVRKLLPCAVQRENSFGNFNKTRLLSRNYIKLLYRRQSNHHGRVPLGIFNSVDLNEPKVLSQDNRGNHNNI